MYGTPGTGKTHCAIGLGIRACTAGMSVLYSSVPRMLVEIKECESKRKLSRFDKWDTIFTDKVVAAAIVDRLTFKSYIIDMNAPSYRISATEQWISERAEKKAAEGKKALK